MHTDTGEQAFDGQLGRGEQNPHARTQGRWAYWPAMAVLAVAATMRAAGELAGWCGTDRKSVV